MPTISRERALAYAVAVLVVLVVAGRYALAGGEPQAAPVLAQADLVATEAPARQLVVHVVGAVRVPGLYRLRDG